MGRNGPTSGERITLVEVLVIVAIVGTIAAGGWAFVKAGMEAKQTWRVTHVDAAGETTKWLVHPPIGGGWSFWEFKDTSGRQVIVPKEGTTIQQIETKTPGG